MPPSTGESRRHRSTLTHSPSPPLLSHPAPSVLEAARASSAHATLSFSRRAILASFVSLGGMGEYGYDARERVPSYILG
jgi:hypothetical protein